MKMSLSTRNKQLNPYPNNSDIYKKTYKIRSSPWTIKSTTSTTITETSSLSKRFLTGYASANRILKCFVEKSLILFLLRTVPEKILSLEIVVIAR